MQADDPGVPILALAAPYPLGRTNSLQVVTPKGPPERRSSAQQFAVP